MEDPGVLPRRTVVIVVEVHGSVYGGVKGRQVQAAYARGTRKWVWGERDLGIMLDTVRRVW
jgi:hypothetical protein